MAEMTMDEVTKEVLDRAKRELDGDAVQQIKASKEAGDKAIRDLGVEGAYNKIADMLAQKEKSAAKQAPSHNVGHVIRCIAMAKGNKQAAEYLSKESKNDFVVKTIQATNFANGGALMPDEFYNEITDYLRNQTIVRAMGVTQVDLKENVLTLPLVSSGSSSAYVAEGTAPNATTLAFGQANLTGKKIIALVPISNDFLRSEQVLSQGGAQIISDDLARSVSETEDSAFLRGTGAAGYPKGLVNLCDSSNSVAQTKAGATVTVAEAGYDLLRCQYLPRAQKVKPFNHAYGISPRTWLALMSARDGNNNPIWLGEMSTGKLYGARLFDTTGIPDNLGSGSDSLILYVADVKTIVIGDNPRMQIEMINNAAYVDSSGSVVSGVSQDESVMRVIARNDIVSRRLGKEIAVITGVDWTKLA